MWISHYLCKETLVIALDLSKDFDIVEHSELMSTFAGLQYLPIEDKTSIHCSKFHYQASSKKVINICILQVSCISLAVVLLVQLPTLIPAPSEMFERVVQTFQNDKSKVFDTPQVFKFLKVDSDAALSFIPQLIQLVT